MTLQVETRAWKKRAREQIKPIKRKKDLASNLNWNEGLFQRLRIAAVAIADHRNGGYQETLRTRAIRSWNHRESLFLLLGRSGRTSYSEIRRLLREHQNSKTTKCKLVNELIYDKVYRCYYEKARRRGTVATISRRHPVLKPPRHRDSTLYWSFLSLLAEDERVEL